METPEQRLERIHGKKIARRVLNNLARIKAHPRFSYFARALAQTEIWAGYCTVEIFGTLWNENIELTLGDVLLTQFHYIIDASSIKWEAQKKITREMPAVMGFLLCKYEPMAEYYMPWIAAEYARAGIIAEYSDGVFTRKFAQMPEISVSIHTNNILVTIQQDRTTLLFDKLTRTHLTPYVDEALALQAIARILPQPIAEAIADCMYGVIARRYTQYTLGAWHPINSQEAWWAEVEYTYIDMFKRPSRSTARPLADSWEEAAALIHAAQ